MPSVALLLAASAAIVGCAALAAAIAANASMRRWRARCAALESSVAALGRELEMIASINVRNGRRVQRIEQEYSAVADRVEVIESRGPAAHFDRAIDWARRGADQTKLTEELGLSRSEAELVTRLHGRV
jgi:hypothetical protein